MTKHPTIYTYVYMLSRCSAYLLDSAVLPIVKVDDANEEMNYKKS